MDILPKHIADMCGIMDEALTRLAPKTSDFQAVVTELDEDGDVQISHRGLVIGWISGIKTDHGPKYRALRPSGQLARFYTQSSALSWLLEEAF